MTKQFVPHFSHVANPFDWQLLPLLRLVLVVQVKNHQRGFATMSC